MSLYWSHIPHCWKSHDTAHMFIKDINFLALLYCYFLTLQCVPLQSFLSDFPQSYQNLLPNCCIDLLPRPVNDANQLGIFMLLWSAAFLSN